MASITSLLNDEIRRLARKEVTTQLDHLKKQSATHRRDIADLKRQIGELQRTIAYLQKQEKGRLEEEPKEELATNVRFSPKSVKNHRAKLNISAADYGKLIGVSPLTVYNWESGKSKPRQKQLAALVKIRGYGKRDAQRHLEMMD